MRNVDTGLLSEQRIRHILERLVVPVGEPLLQEVARLFAEVVGARYGVVGTLLPTPAWRRTVAAWDGEKFLPEFGLDIRGTPCERVLQGQVFVVSGDAQARFPEDRGLAAFGIQSYVWLPIFGPAGAVLGNVCAFHPEPLRGDVDLQVLELLAARAGAELARMRAEERLSRSEARLQLALSATADGLVDWNLLTGGVEGNDALFEMLGYAPGELTHALQWMEAVHPDDRARVRKGLVEHLKGRAPVFSEEVRVRNRHGTYQWILARGKAVERDPDGRGLRMLGLHTDIDARKRLEREVEISTRMASLGTLAAGIAHELNTPLAYVFAGLESLSGSLARLSGDPAAREAAWEALRASQEGVGRLLETVHGVRTLSRLPEPAPAHRTRTTEALEMALRMTRKQLVEHARLETELGPLPEVLAHPSQLGQVFVNLLVNAVQALPEPDPARHLIRVCARTEPDGRALITVSDSGSGIPEHLASRLFDPFFTTKPDGLGTGLGLAICHRTVEALGGEIRFESEVGRGTTFRVWLPPAPPSGEREAPAGAPSPRPEAQGRARVLVVDDHPSMGSTLKLLLQEQHDVVAVASGREALERVRAGERYDVVLCDLMMPGFNGMQLHAQLSEDLPAIARRFVFMTGGAYTPEAQRFLSRSAHRVLEKPFSAHVLRDAVQDALRR